MTTKILLAACFVGVCIGTFAPAQDAASEPDKPMNLGFEAGQLGEMPRGWFVPVPGWKAELSDDDATSGSRSAKLFPSGDSNAPFGNLLKSMRAAPVLGKHIRLSAKIRVEGDGARAQMWLRVDRPNRQMGLFDNMGDRPIRTSKWSDAVIEGDVDPDAAGLVLGIMSFGRGTVFIDDVMLEVSESKTVLQAASPPKSLSDRELANLTAASRLLAYVRFFHPSDDVIETKGWDEFAAELMRSVESAKDADELALQLQQQFQVIAPALQIWSGNESDAPDPPQPTQEAQGYRYWVHRGAGLVASGRNLYSSRTQQKSRDDMGNKSTVLVKSLGGGVCCRLPVYVPIGKKESLPKSTQENPWASSASTAKLTVANRATRQAGVATCWGVMQHFYPYFDVVDTDWSSALETALREASEDADGKAYLHTMQRLVAKLHDGHGNVFGQLSVPTHRLPVSLQWAGEHCVINGKHSSVDDRVDVGDAIIAVDGKPIAVVCEDLSSRISASTQGFRRTRQLQQLILRGDAAAVAVTLRKPDGTEYSVEFSPVGVAERIEPQKSRPEPGEMLDEGIVYFDLSRASNQDLDKVFNQLESAEGIVFDLRGYPADAALRLIPYLIDERASSAQWNVPVITMPDGEDWQWQTSAWDLRPNEEPLDAEIAFLTDGRAISYAESIMGIVEHYKLGEIVGATTAGTNGNVNPFSLPGGIRVSWTGMKVLKHDGSQHHGVGIKPTVPIAPTPIGIAEGRDEVLDKAVEILKQRIAKSQ